MVGRTFSLADSETKKAKGTNHWHSVKYAITCRTNTSGNTIAVNYVGCSVADPGSGAFLTHGSGIRDG
jgi:hypothetical protein